MPAGEKARNKFESHLLPAMDALYQSACAYAGNPNDAEDLVQETVLKACRRFSTYNPGSDFKAWIVRILANTFIDGYRWRKRHRSAGEEPLSSKAARPELDLSRRDMEFLLADDAHKALQHLPSEQRMAVLLVDVNDFSNDEAAGIMNSPLGTLNSRLARGRIALREGLRRIADENREVYKKG